MYSGPGTLALTGGLTSVALATGLQVLWGFLALATIFFVVSAVLRLVPRRQA